MSSIDNHLAVHAKAITLRSARAELLAGNLANADTPGYRARDLDFATAMKNANAANGGSILSTHPAHIPLNNIASETRTYYRETEQKALDENTVNSEYERIQFADNDVRYQASVQFLTGKINSLVRAIRGE